MSSEIEVRVNEHVITKEPSSAVCIIIKTDRLEEGYELHVRFTQEGIVADLVESGLVVQTLSNMYDEFVEDLLI